MIITESPAFFGSQKVNTRFSLIQVLSPSIVMTVGVGGDGISTKEIKRIDMSNRGHTISKNGGRSGSGSGATSDSDVIYVRRKDFWSRSRSRSRPS
jgi:hypothetical protein